MNNLFGDEEKTVNTEKLARNTDPHTSHEAAASQSAEKMQRSQAKILAILRSAGPLTDEEILAFIKGDMTGIDLSPSGARTRRKELVEKHLVKDSGRRGRTVSGRKTIIWEAVS